jgi:hypothetical protein
MQVVLPAQLRALVGASGAVTIEIKGEASQRSVLDALEASYPVLRGTLRDRSTRQRRPFVRFFAGGLDVSQEAEDAPLPPAVADGREPFLIIGAIAGG